MGKVTAKVKLSTKTTGPGDPQLVFYADYADGRNKEWASATPSLNLTMTVKPEVADMFEVGATYTLTFEPQEG